MGDQQAGHLLHHAAGRLAHQHALPQLVRLQFVDRQLQLPAAVIQLRQFEGGVFVLIQQRRDQPVFLVVGGLHAGQFVFDDPHGGSVDGPAALAALADAKLGQVGAVGKHAELVGLERPGEPPEQVGPALSHEVQVRRAVKRGVPHQQLSGLHMPQQRHGHVAVGPVGGLQTKVEHRVGAQFAQAAELGLRKRRGWTAAPFAPALGRARRTKDRAVGGRVEEAEVAGIDAAQGHALVIRPRRHRMGQRTQHLLGQLDQNARPDAAAGHAQRVSLRDGELRGEGHQPPPDLPQRVGAEEAQSDDQPDRQFIGHNPAGPGARTNLADRPFHQAGGNGMLECADALAAGQLRIRGGNRQTQHCSLLAEWRLHTTIMAGGCMFCQRLIERY